MATSTSTKTGKSDVEKAVAELEKVLTAQAQAGSSIRREGDCMIIPENKSIDQAINDLEAWKKSLEEEVDTHHTFKCHPNDGIVAFYRSVTRSFGELMPKAIETFFGKMPGDSVTIPISPTESLNCPVGVTEIPGLNVTMVIKPSSSDNSLFEGNLTIMFRAPRKYNSLIEKIIAATEEELRVNSIYKGKAIDSNFNFIDLRNFDPASVIFSRRTTEQIEANVLFPITRTAEWTALNNSLKRGILLSGKYGTGKTLLARMLGSVCPKNGWTYILVAPQGKIETALQIARYYEPSVVFFEDIDFETTKSRDNKVNTILNTIDGILSKDAKVMTVMTTNHDYEIEPAMMRPGRIDSLIKLTVPDQEALERFIRYHGHGLVVDTLNMDEIAAAAQGYVPAFIVEGLTKAKTYAALHKSDVVTTEELVAAFNELREQYDLMLAENAPKVPDLVQALEHTITNANSPFWKLFADKFGLKERK